jgi:hypothetical protein
MGREGGGETKDGKEKIKQKMITKKTERTKEKSNPKETGVNQR